MGCRFVLTYLTACSDVAWCMLLLMCVSSFRFSHLLLCVIQLLRRDSCCYDDGRQHGRRERR